MTEACDVPAALVLGEAYELACQHFAAEHPAPLDRAIPTYAPNLMIGIVPRILQRASAKCGPMAANVSQAVFARGPHSRSSL
jgi:hypothetical protein